jgi:hypothetical protein
MRPLPTILALALALVAALACGGDKGTGPASVASIAVTSPIGNRLGLGRAVQLSAEARDAGGHVIPGVPFTWGSSATGIAAVSTAGVVSGLAGGDAAISAHADGVSGRLVMRVVDWDAAGITAALNDEFASALAASLTSAVRVRVQAALGQCSSGITQGNFATIEGCVASVRAEVTGATDPTDRALLATLALYVNHIQRLLNL